MNELELMNELNLIVKRINDYKLGDAAKQRAELVRRWREAHPEAAAEASSAHKPLIRLDPYPHGADDPDEVWFNDTYTVSLRRREDKVFGNRGGMIQLGISSLDGTARLDWRDFQAIKNQLAGPETEAFELYPAEARLLDPSNYYTLWCFPGLNRIKVGQDYRRVLDADIALAPQRAFPKEPANDAG